jgi:hypothetical protein
MLTAAHLRLLGQRNAKDWDQAHAILRAATGDPNAYQLVVATLAETDQEGVAFWCLDALIKQFGPLLAADAERLIPVLLDHLVRPFAVVPDRAAWALNVAGPASVPALLRAYARASDPAHRARYLGALRDNSHLLVHAAAVLACFTQGLQDPVAQVRYWALVVTMDVSPLRFGWDKSRLPLPAFEALYRAALPVAEEFIHTPYDERDEEMVRRYHALIVRHLHRTEKKA